jgi:hypothetical protein
MDWLGLFLEAITSSLFVVSLRSSLCFLIAFAAAITIGYLISLKFC